MPLRAFFCWLLLALAGSAGAQSLPPLRVDPSLLGGVVVEKKAKPAEATAKPDAKATSDAEAGRTTQAAKPQAAPPAKPLALDGPQKLEGDSPAKPEPAVAPAARTVQPAPAEETPVSQSRSAEKVQPRTEAAVESGKQVAPAVTTAEPARAVPSAPTSATPQPVPAAIAPAAAIPPAARQVASAAPAESPARTISLEATRTAGGATLPPLRVNAALLAPPPKAPEAATRYATAQPARPAAATESASAATRAPPPGRPIDQGAPVPLESNAPPTVAERPVLPPLYSAHVEAGELPDMKLKTTTAMAPLSRSPDEPRPTFLSAKRMNGKTDIEMVAEGDVELRKIGTVINADKLTYWQIDDEVEAVGNVRLERDQDVVTGPKMRMRVEENVGYFEQPSYSITRMTRAKTLTPIPGMELPLVQSTATGSARRIDFEGENQMRLSDATYSTCSPSSRDWYVDVADLKLDYDREVGEGSDGKIVFMGQTILYSPWLSFSLNNERKSGFLTPTLGSTSKSGFEVTAPWYWNIAPNMDATIVPRTMSKRGTQWNTEYRYLNHMYSGQARIEYLPDDQLAHKRRSGYSIMHTQNFGYGFAGNLNLNGVSDDTYFSDLSTRLSAISQGNLLRQGMLSYGGGGWWSVTAMAQTYQTLLDPAFPTTAPYKRLPQISLAATRPDLPAGLSATFSGEYVDFRHPTNVIGRRTIAYPQISLPIQTSFFQMTPKLGMHVTRYALDRQGAGNPQSVSRNLPIFSLDSSVIFEREMSLAGRAMTQTLEPRLYYLYVPNRDQSKIPVFDSGINDFNFAQIFAENRYGGSDRIGDANQVTAAVVSRLIDPATGAEVLRGALAQRYYFTTQHVTLPAVGTAPAEVPRSSRKADILAAVSGQVMPKAWLDTAIQYNPRDSRTERLNFGGRYQPESGKVLNAGYRYTRDQLGQVDASGQWPLSGGWHAVGRYNYSTRENRVVEVVGGLEYQADCWVARFVVQRLAIQAQQSTTAFFVQLELNGLSRLGSNPLEILKRNIPGYGLINQPTADPIFGAN